MDNNENKEQPGMGGSAGEPSIPRRPSGNGKWYAIIAVLIVVIAALGVMGFYHPVSTGTTVTAVNPSNTATFGNPYSLTLKTNGQFKEISVYFGDGTVTTIPYTGSDTVTVNHTYQSPGAYNIYYTTDFGSTVVNNSGNLIPVVTSGYSSNLANGAYGSLFLQNNSALSLSNNTVTVHNNKTIGLVAGLQAFPLAGEVIGQTVNLYQGNVLNTSHVLPYYFNVSSQAYTLPIADSSFNISGLPTGYYQLEVQTTSGVVSSQSYLQSGTFNVTSSAKVNAGPVTFHKNVQHSYQNGTFNATMYYVYMNNTQVSMSNGNVSYANGANVTYKHGAAVNFSAGDSANFLGYSNFTLSKDTNVTFAVNNTKALVKNSTNAWNLMTFDNTTTYQLNATAYNFTNGANMMLANNFLATFDVNSTVVLGAGSAVQFMGSSEYTYHGNTSLFYMDNVTTVDFTANAHFTEISEMTGSTTIQAASTGMVDPTQGVYTTSYWVDLPVFNQAAYNVPVVGFPAYVPTTSASGSFLRAELETGGYKTLDPAIAYDTVSYEIIMNTMLPLVSYNGSSSSSFVPMLAKELPSVANGGINTNYANYTVKSPWGSSYAVNVTPYENYTFYINNATKWQDGSSVKAWDVMYSFTRTLLFDAGSPGTPGWIQAQYLLPGNYYATNTFWNITQNMTVNNATNSITFHFQQPMNPNLTFETFGQTSGAQITDAKWLIQHGAGITWSAAGFEAYKAQGNAGNYNTYVQNNIMADGPYTLAYSVPSQEVVLQANPNFASPNPYYTTPKVKTVVLQYIPEESTAYLELKSNYSQSSNIPTSNWNQVLQLQKAGIIAKPIEFPTLNLFWYNYNANVNTTMLAGQVSSANLPSTLFDSLNVRRAFAYAYNYNYYLNQQVGNAIYNTQFASNYAGMLPAGMLGNMSMKVLNGTTGNHVPYYNLSQAKSDWNAFIHGKMATAMGVTNSSGTDTYSGHALNIPIFIFSADPVDLAGATTWGQTLQKVIPGLQFEVVPTPFPTLLGNQVQGQNPMPIYELGWAPDYPYPTDYLGPMAYPSNSTTYPGPNSMTPYWFNGDSNNPLKGQTSMVNQAHNLTDMANLYLSAGANPGNAVPYYKQMNSMLVNMTFYTYIEQQNGFVIINSAFNQSLVSQYQLNIMESGAGFQYNMLAYN